jgi:hypothetical protein
MPNYHVPFGIQADEQDNNVECAWYPYSWMLTMASRLRRRTSSMDQLRVFELGSAAPTNALSAAHHSESQAQR